MADAWVSRIGWLGASTQGPLQVLELYASSFWGNSTITPSVTAIAQPRGRYNILYDTSEHYRENNDQNIRPIVGCIGRIDSYSVVPSDRASNGAGVGHPGLRVAETR